MIKKEGLTITEFITSKEASNRYGKHESTIKRITKQFFSENIDYRKIGNSEQLLINKHCLEAYFNNPSSFTENIHVRDKKYLADYNFKI